MRAQAAPIALVSVLLVSAVGCPASPPSTGGEAPTSNGDTPAPATPSPPDSPTTDNLGDPPDPAEDTRAPRLRAHERTIAHDPVDTLAMRLGMDVTKRTAEAEIDVRVHDGSHARFDVADLQITAVTVDGEAAVTRADPPWLEVDLPPVSGKGPREYTLRFTYGFSQHDDAEGLGPTDVTLSWPYHCGKLFPCDPDPADGFRTELSLTGVPEGKVAVTPPPVTADAPPYMLAWAIGDYETTELGRTKAGTRVLTIARKDEQEAMARGTKTLVGEFQFLEETLGKYAYGAEVASVSVTWPPGQYGGMEHHPYWHIADHSLEDLTVHAHEAAHGWFGNGVRVACWEDFVLSEGLATYLAARARESAAGEAAGALVWEDYEKQLQSLQASTKSKIAWWPDQCRELDVLKDGVFSSAPYIRGAWYFRSLEARVGREALDASLRRFYETNVGGAARFADLLEAIERDTAVDPRPCAEAWLRSEDLPATRDCTPA